MIAPTLTDDMRARAALRYLDARDRANGNADAYHTPDVTGWGGYWRAKAAEHEAEALHILPAADAWDAPAPAFIGGA
jgi:hypothetical protein